MLNFIYYPISGVLLFWHKAMGFVFGPDSGISWVLAIVLLTFTVRLLLLKPMVNQMRSSRKMQEIQPKMQEIRQKYKNDQAKMVEETRKLQKEAGVNPAAGCIPVLVQMPVFIGLLHVLKSFNRTGTARGQLGLTPEQNYNTPNYFFSVDDVQSFLDATLFGVPLSAYIRMPQEMYAAFPKASFTKTDIMMVAIPLIAFTVIMTHMNARVMFNRQQKRIASGKQQAPGAGGPNAELMQSQMQMMNKMMMWFIPAMILFTGVAWHLGLLFYMASNNVWTFAQNYFVFKKMDAEEEAEIEAKKALKRTTAPAPGARTNKKKTKKQRKKGK